MACWNSVVIGWLLVSGICLAGPQSQPGSDSGRSAVPRTDLPAPPPLPKTVDPAAVRHQARQFIKELDSADFRVRLAASRKLSEVAVGAVDELRMAAAQGSLEVRVRVIEILKTMYISPKDRESTAADAVLEGLAESGDPEVAMAANLVLTDHSDLRDRRAWQQIQRLGGRRRDLNQQRIIVPNGAAVPIQQTVTNIELDEQWTGGDEGLKYFKRLNSIGALYLIDGANVSQEAVDALHRVIPGLNVQRRGSAYLGIAGAPNPLGAAGCLVVSVKVNSAAFRAQIQRSDVITKFDGVEIQSFEGLITQIKTKKAGQRVTVEISRRGQPLVLDVTLGRWSDK